MIGPGRVIVPSGYRCLPEDGSLGFSYPREGLGLGLGFTKLEKWDQNRSTGLFWCYEHLNSIREH